jgi:hypothetical protein
MPWSPPAKQSGPHLGRHVGCFNDILDADGHAIDGRQRRSGLPALRGSGGFPACAIDFNVHEGANLALMLPHAFETALQEIARGVVARSETTGAGDVGLNRWKLMWLFWHFLAKTFFAVC